MSRAIKKTLFSQVDGGCRILMLYVIGIVGIMLVGSCSSKKHDDTDDEKCNMLYYATPENVAEVEDIDYGAALPGKWHFAEISDGTNVINPDTIYFIRFSQYGYKVETGCNEIIGDYTVDGDSISWNNGLKTSMWCDDMVVEAAVYKVLFNVRRLSFDNDSTLRLCTFTPNQYILLTK